MLLLAYSDPATKSTRFSLTLPRYILVQDLCTWFHCQKCSCLAIYEICFFLFLKCCLLSEAGIPSLSSLKLHPHPSHTHILTLFPPSLFSKAVITIQCNILDICTYHFSSLTKKWALWKQRLPSVLFTVGTPALAKALGAFEQYVLPHKYLLIDASVFSF